MKRKFQVRFGEGRSEKQAKLLAGRLLYTTSSVHTGYALTAPGEASGPSALVVDLDPQAQCSSVLGIEQGPGLFHYMLADGDAASKEIGNYVQVTGRRRLLLMPGSSKTVALVGALKAQMDARQLRIEEVAARLRALGEVVEHVVLDTPASGVLQEAAVMAADLVVVPTGLEYLDMEAVPATLAMIEGLRPNGVVAILPTLMDNRIGDHKTHLAALCARYGEAVCEPIHRRAAVGDAISLGKLINEVDPACIVVEEYAALAKKLISWGSGR